MWWFEVVVVVVVVAVACLVVVVFEPGDRIWMEKITDKQEPAAARRDGLYEPSLDGQATLSM
jgi:hypothetical protein